MRQKLTIIPVPAWLLHPEQLITANADNEVLSISDNGITEGAENSRIITVNLSGGTFVNSVAPANWTLTNLPTGVTKGSVTRISSTQVQVPSPVTGLPITITTLRTSLLR
ncbi:MAG: hypothetical protein U0T82_14655 [Bacteroidales bacterium]